MKISFNKTLKMTNKLKFNSNFSDSLRYLELSNSHMPAEILKQIHDNPFLKASHLPSRPISLNDELEIPTHQKSLKTHLYEQLSERNDVIDYIIQSLDHKGFFTESPEFTAKHLNCDIDKFHNALKTIQSLDPCGVAARDSIHAIQLQVNNPLVTRILNHHQDLLESKDYDKIAQLNNVPIESIYSSLSLMQDTSPYPCSNYYNGEKSEIIVPDISISVVNKEIILEDIDNYNIKIDNDLMHDDPNLKAFLAEAKVIIKNITRRNTTLILIANELVNVQSSYFLFNDELNYCTQTLIAERLKISVSTVSRALKYSYFNFLGKVYPLSSLLVTKTKSGHSSDSIKKAIEIIVEEEDPSNPLNDESIKEALLSFNLEASIRTINKYRNDLGIPTFGKRKR